MEWRIRESSHGGYMAEYGANHQGGVFGPSRVGVTLPAFIVYRSIHFDTKKQAERYIKKQASA